MTRLKKNESYYTSSDALRMRQGLQTIRLQKGSTPESCPVTQAYQTSYITCPRIEASNTETFMRGSAVPDDCVITLSAAYVSKTFKTGQHSQGRRSRRITRMFTLRMRLPNGKCLHCHLQPLPVYNINMFQADNHSPCAQKH